MAKEKSKGKKKTVAAAKKSPAKAGKKTVKAKSVKPAKPSKKVAVKASTGSASSTRLASSTRSASPKGPASGKKQSSKKKGDTLMCFLTTACVNYYALPDNGYELSTLRNYRDTYLAASTTGKDLIEQYYKISPGIVKRIDKDADKRSVYTYIYSIVTKACAEIENRDLAGAQKTYTGMVKKLMKRYKPD